MAALGLAILVVHLAALAVHAGEIPGVPSFRWGTDKAAVRKALPKGFAACRPTDGNPFGTEACLIAGEERTLSPYGTWLYFRDGALVGWSVRSDSANRQAMLAALQERFGVPTEQSDARIAWRGPDALVWTTFALSGDVDMTYAATLEALAGAPADREAARTRAELRRPAEQAPATPRPDDRGEAPVRRPNADKADDDGGKSESRRRGLPPRWRFGP